MPNAGTTGIPLKFILAASVICLLENKIYSYYFAPAHLIEAAKIHAQSANTLRRAIAPENQRVSEQMRAITTYTNPEWLRLYPLFDRLKRFRNIVTDQSFRLLRASGQEEFLAENDKLRGKNLCVTIAFNTPWVIELLIHSAAKYIDAQLIIMDNSNNPKQARKISALCADHGIPYLKLPFNIEWNGSRSHGIALNWSYYNVIRMLRPPVFAFLDHDMFPLEPIQLASQLGDQPFYGRKKNGFRFRSFGPSGWHLWAGYSIFDFTTLDKCKPDFNNDISHGLDTGGQNYFRFFKNYDPEEMRFAYRRIVDFSDPKDDKVYSVQMNDSFVHVGGAAYRNHDIQFYRRLIDAQIAKLKHNTG